MKMTDYIDAYGNTKVYNPDTHVKVVEDDMKEPVDERYRLSIYPDGYNDKIPDGGVAHLIFDDNKEAWDDYKKKEWFFCQDEYNAYLTSPHDNRKFYRDEFYKKRVTFARQSNFVPNKLHKDEWMQQNEVDDKVLA